MCVYKSRFWAETTRGGDERLYDTRERGRARLLYAVIQVDLVLIAVFRCVN